MISYTTGCILYYIPDDALNRVYEFAFVRDKFNGVAFFYFNFFLGLGGSLFLLDLFGSIFIPRKKLVDLGDHFFLFGFGDGRPDLFPFFKCFTFVHTGSVDLIPVKTPKTSVCRIINSAVI